VRDLKSKILILAALLLVGLNFSCSSNAPPPAASLAPSTAASTAEASPLPSWNDGPAKQAIIDFVKTTTDKSNPKFVPPEDRIATFDQDGTMWVEQPIYSQVLFAFDRAVALAPQQPGMENQRAFQSGDHR
jgi:hypothetical protein